MAQNFLEGIEGILTILNEAEITLGLQTNNPGKNLAASLTWSSAGRMANAYTDLIVLDSPSNPRRPRSPDARATQVLRLEAQIDEAEFLTSWFASQASRQFLPSPDDFLDARPLAPKGGVLSAEDMASMTGLSPKLIADAQATDKAREQARADLKALALQDHGRELRAKLANALECAPNHAPSDLSPYGAVAVTSTMARKLTDYVMSAVSRLQRTVIPRQQAELAGQIRIMTSMAERADALMVEAQHEAETSSFEPARSLQEDVAHDSRVSADVE